MFSTRSHLPLLKGTKLKNQVNLKYLLHWYTSDANKFSPERSAYFQTSTTQDPVLMTFKTTLITEWPVNKCSSLSEITGCIKMVALYTKKYTLRITESPSQRRNPSPNYLQSRRHRICLKKARDVVFWPGMSHHVKEIATNCQVCAEFQACNPSGNCAFFFWFQITP